MIAANNAPCLYYHRNRSVIGGTRNRSRLRCRGEIFSYILPRHMAASTVQRTPRLIYERIPMAVTLCSECNASAPAVAENKSHNALGVYLHTVITYGTISNRFKSSRVLYAHISTRFARYDPGQIATFPIRSHTPVRIESFYGPNGILYSSYGFSTRKQWRFSRGGKGGGASLEKIKRIMCIKFLL